MGDGNGTGTISFDLPRWVEEAETIERDGARIRLTPDEVMEAGDAAELRWFADELAYRLQEPDLYRLEKAAGAVGSGLLDPNVLLERCWGDYYEYGRSDGVSAYIERGAGEAMADLPRVLWKELGDVPIEPGTEGIDADWRIFAKGTSRYEIWHWFEDEFGVGAARDLMRIG